MNYQQKVLQDSARKFSIFAKKSFLEKKVECYSKTGWWYSQSVLRSSHDLIDDLNYMRSITIRKEWLSRINQIYY